MRGRLLGVLRLLRGVLLLLGRSRGGRRLRGLLLRCLSLLLLGRLLLLRIGCRIGRFRRIDDRLLADLGRLRLIALCTVAAGLREQTGDGRRGDEACDDHRARGGCNEWMKTAFMRGLRVGIVHV